MLNLVGESIDMHRVRYGVESGRLILATGTPKIETVMGIGSDRPRLRSCTGQDRQKHMVHASHEAFAHRVSVTVL